MTLFKSILFSVVISVSTIMPAGAYEVDTHALMTYHSFDRSVLAGTNFTTRWGVDRFEQTQPFFFPLPSYPHERNAYFDLMPIDWGLPNFNAYRRTLNAYEQLQYPALGNYRGVRTNERQLRAWLMRGAVREDDLRQSSYEEHEPRPEVDPHGEFTRVFHHFYDPIHDQPLAPLISCFFLPGALAEGCLPATDWALGAVNVANQPTASASTGRRNHFSWADGREALWCALTHKPEPNAPEENAGDRRICWATAIKSLGHVLHLLQDSAQPQHVRNDVHNPPNASWFHYENPFAADDQRRLYEVWTNYRATDSNPAVETDNEVSVINREKGAFKRFFQRSRQPITAVTAGNYPVPRFSLPVKYFTTRAEDAAPAARRGLADFTNRNFFSEGPSSVPTMLCRLRMRLRRE